jgi:hypothetical protein
VTELPVTTLFVSQPPQSRRVLPVAENVNEVGPQEPPAVAWTHGAMKLDDSW